MAQQGNGSQPIPHLSVVVPVYRAAACLKELHRRLTAAVAPIAHDYEILLVEDCGGDGSWEIIAELARGDPRVKGLQFSRNFGQHYGITAGVDHSRGDWIVVMDCDLQDSPEAIPRLYAKAREGYDVVVARRIRRKDALLKRLMSSVFYRVFSYLTEVPYDESVGNFRILSRKAADQFRTMRERLRLFGGLVDWLGFPTASVDIEHAPRFGGKTAYTWPMLIRLAAGAIIAYSDKPLRLTVSFGFLMSAFSFVVGIYLLLRALVVGSPVTGWSSLIVSLYFLAGVVISILGILGLYLGKVFDEVKKRPLYVIAKRENV